MINKNIIKRVFGKDNKLDRQIIEISKDGFYLSLNRGFLIVENKEAGIFQKIDLSTILSLVISANDVLLSKNIINAICDQGGSIICCGQNYLPKSVILPYIGHWLMAPRIKQQIECSKPLQKNLWKSIIQNKIYNQARVLQLFFPENQNIERLKKLSKDTLSDDATNNEGLAAGIYFKSLYGKNFKRERLNTDINLLLNYAYTVLRAMVARAVVGNGLQPYWGLKHCAKTNPLPLVDDLMEPFRVIADKIVFEEINKLVNIEHINLTPEIKRNITKIITYPVQISKGVVSLHDGIYDFVGSLVTSFEHKKIMLKYPDIFTVNN